MKSTLIIFGVLIVLVGGGIIFFLYGTDYGPNHTTSTLSDKILPSSKILPKPPAESPVATSNWKQMGTAISGAFADADVVLLAENSYRMYYAIQPEVSGHNFEIYSATSTDGQSWTEEPGTRKTGATFPDVVKFSDEMYRLYYQNDGVIKSAISTDGLKFTDEDGIRIDKTNDLGLVFDNVAAPTVLSSDGALLMVYRATIDAPYVGEKVPNNNTQILLWALSRDGLIWGKRGIAVDSRTSLYGLADGPELFEEVFSDHNSIKLSFWSYQGVFWSTFAHASFGKPEKVFALVESTTLTKFPTPTPGDPTYAKIGNTWFMYYGQKDGIYYATLSN